MALWENLEPVLELAAPGFVLLYGTKYAIERARGPLGFTFGKTSEVGERGRKLAMGSEHDPKSWQNMARTNFRRGRLRRREAVIGTMNKRELEIGKGQEGKLSLKQRAQRRVYSTAARAVGYGDYEGAISEANKSEAERIATHQTYGPDSTVRAQWAYEKDGRYYNYATGQEMATADVKMARRVSGKNLSALQESLSYEMTKADNDETYGKLMSRYMDRAQELGLSEDEANGVWIGPAFKNKTMRLEQKARKFKKGADGKFYDAGINYDSFSSEAANKFKQYDYSGIQSSTFGAMGDDIKVLAQKNPAQLNAKELTRMQHYYHALTNLEAPTMMPGGDGGTPGGVPAGARAASFGGSGVSSAQAKEAMSLIKDAAQYDSRITQLPSYAGMSGPVAYQEARSDYGKAA
ncbi:MAG TPA: hypothetical protein VMY99_00795 [Nevskiaceae bacterium]|nr:hypothetical protein [Nevskiaceae bacterium]